MRSSGILLHISSLSSEYGIGTLGREAREFVEFLVKAGQRYWQLLPIGPVGEGDSPYQSFSTFAGNPYFIDLQMLIEEGLLRKPELSRIDWGKDKTKVDYNALFVSRFKVLYLAYLRGWSPHREEYARFLAENESWLPDYALFMAIKEYFDFKPWNQWPDEGIRLRRPDSLQFFRDKLRDRVQFWGYLQFLFFRQWHALKEYANGRGVELIGDMPIYLAMDSADAWAHPELLQLDEYRAPTAVAGCPPDAFSADGQLWGNPLYDWEYLRYTGYQWWLERLATLLRRYDLLRVDHFRGLEAYYSIPAGEETARGGHWEKGPGMALFHTISEKLGPVRLIAEDLGYLTWETIEMVRQCGFPGMKVLQFAFQSGAESTHLPHTYERNCVVYTGTHDNDTLRGWLRSLSKEDSRFCFDYLGIKNHRELCWAMLHLAWQSVADTAIAPMQDFLELGREARMNTPATLGGNWQWRMRKGADNDRLAGRIARMTEICGRKK